MINKNFKEFAQLLNANHVEYMVVGGYALWAHGHPRYTGDIDFWIKPEAENARRLLRCLEAFGFGSLNLKQQEFEQVDAVIQLGYPPTRIDLMTSISGVQFDEAYAHRIIVNLDGLELSVIGLQEFIRNKKTIGRHKDLGDIEAVTGVELPKS